MQQWPADKVERWPIDRLVPYARNARTHSDAQVEQVAASIREWGWTNPVLVGKDGGIIAGHCRVLAAKKLGVGEIPVMLAIGWTEAQKRAYLLADNQLALNAGWDTELLRVEIGELRALDFNLGLIGFDEAPPLGLTDPESVPPVPASSSIQLGDLWLLGDHRLLCGDATSDTDVTRLMQGERAALFSTDPPYAVGYVGGQDPESDANRGSAKRNKNWSKVYQEATQEEDGEAFYSEFIGTAVRHAIEKNAAWYCWHSSIRAPMVERVWNANGAFAHQQIIWVKSRAVLTYSVYMWQHEPCLMGWLRGNKPRIKSRGQEFQTTVWSVASSEIESKDHPTSKPTRLFRVPMEVHTLPGDICYEPFSGSGSQIIAAQMLGRKCYAIEIAPRFVEVAIERWQNFTGEKATLDGRAFDEIAAERKEAA